MRHAVKRCLHLRSYERAAWRVEIDGVLVLLLVFLVFRLALLFIPLLEGVQG